MSDATNTEWIKQLKPGDAVAVVDLDKSPQEVWLVQVSAVTASAIGCGWCSFTPDGKPAGQFVRKRWRLVPADEKARAAAESTALADQFIDHTDWRSLPLPTLRAVAAALATPTPPGE